MTHSDAPLFSAARRAAAFVVLGGLCWPAAAIAQQGPALPDEDPNVIVVTASLRGAVRTAIPSEVQLDQTIIGALGASNLAEVVEVFGPQARSARSDDDPILLLNGRRIGSRAEIDALPPEAILRMEIFPEEVALQYGYPPDRRVVNVILRPNYDAKEVQIRGAIPLGDGRGTYRAKANLLHLTPEGRVSADLGYQRETARVDEQSGTGVDERWRLPRTDQLTANGTYAATLGDISLTANASGRWQLGQSKLGRGPNGLGLDRDARQMQGRAGLTLGAETGDWLWSAAGAVELLDDQIETADSTGALAAKTGYSVSSTRRDALLDITGGGSLGPINASIGTGFALRRHEAHDLLTPGQEVLTKQDSAYALANVDIPLLADEAAVVFGEGRIAAASSNETIGRYGLGLRGKPLENLSLSGSYSRERALPDFTALAQTRVLTPNVRVYDFASGGTTLIERQEGGNPALLAPLTRTYAFRAQFKPLAERDLSLSVDYTDLSIRNGTSGILGLTPQVEAALPGRFIRDISGTLTWFDQSPISIFSEHQRQLRWGVNLTTPLGAKPEAKDAPERPQLQLALYHTWMLQDDARITASSPTIDLLDGAAIGELGGVSRHRLEVQAGYASPRFGVRLFTDWKGPREIDDPTSGHRLTFRDGLNINARIYFRLEDLFGWTGLSFLKGRFDLSMDNILGQGSKIRDENGNPVDYYGVDDGGSARAFQLAFRKRF